jgi:hypothetical protein
MLHHAGLVLLYVVLFLLNASLLVGLPGGWIALAGIAAYALATRFSTLHWKTLAVMAALAVLGEVVESLLGVVYVSRKGASPWGVLGAFAGGIAGAILGTAAVPVIGSIVFAFAGAFAGAVLGEYLRYRSLDRALRTGFAAFIGKLAATFAKFVLALLILALFIYRTW